MCDLPDQVPFLRIKSVEGQVLKWGAAERAETYHVEISFDDLTWKAFPKAIQQRRWKIPPVKAPKRFALRVRAKNSCGYGEYSSIVYAVPNTLELNNDLTWVSPVRSESDKYMTHSPRLQLNIEKTESNTLYFKPQSNFRGILVFCKELVTSSINDEEVEFVIPDGSIIFSNGPAEGLRKVFVNASQGRKFTYNDGSEFAKNGFTVGSLTDGINVQTLRKLGYISERGICRFWLVHIVNGTGYAYAYLSPKNTTENCVLPPETVSAVQNESNVTLTWQAVSGLTKVYKRVGNEWGEIAVLPAGSNLFVDKDVIPGEIYCYKVGTDCLPEIQNKACVFVKSIQ